MPVSIDDILSMFIEQRTKGQSKCQIWKELHKGGESQAIDLAKYSPLVSVQRN